MSRGEHDPGDASLKTPVRVNISRSLDLYHKYRLQRRNANPPGDWEVVPSGSSFLKIGFGFQFVYVFFLFVVCCFFVLLSRVVLVDEFPDGIQPLEGATRASWAGAM